MNDSHDLPPTPSSKVAPNVATAAAVAAALCAVLTFTIPRCTADHAEAVRIGEDRRSVEGTYQGRTLWARALIGNPGEITSPIHLFREADGDPVFVVHQGIDKSPDHSIIRLNRDGETTHVDVDLEAMDFVRSYSGHFKMRDALRLSTNWVAFSFVDLQAPSCLVLYNPITLSIIEIRTAGHAYDAALDEDEKTLVVALVNNHLFQSGSSEGSETVVAFDFVALTQIAEGASDHRAVVEFPMRYGPVGLLAEAEYTRRVATAIPSVKFAWSFRNHKPSLNRIWISKRNIITVSFGNTGDGNEPTHSLRLDPTTGSVKPLRHPHHPWTEEMKPETWIDPKSDKHAKQLEKGQHETGVAKLDAQIDVAELKKIPSFRATVDVGQLPNDAAGTAYGVRLVSLKSDPPGATVLVSQGNPDHDAYRIFDGQTPVNTSLGTGQYIARFTLNGEFVIKRFTIGFPLSVTD